MKSLEESIATSLDCLEEPLLPYLPYILQDFWEIGASPEVIINLIRKHKQNYSSLAVLDLGCGKGAVSIKVALDLQCHCLGIDALSEFIDEAKRKAKEYQVDSLCTFETNDIRQRVTSLKGYDVIILGAIGPVFGNYEETLTQIAGCLKDDGLVIIDDGYIEDSSSYSHPLLVKRRDLLSQVNAARMQLIDEVIMTDGEGTHEEYAKELGYIVNRCTELMRRYPDKTALFENYIRQQKEEYEVLENKVVCVTMVIGKK